MADIEIEYNDHRLAALEKALKAQDKNISEELLPELDLMYEKYVPDEIRYDIEALIKREETELHKSEGCFAVYHLHDDFDDYHFTDEFDNTFYDAACRYSEMLEYGYKSKAMDTIAQEYFSDHQPVNASLFSVLCNAMPKDHRISALIEFDLENETVSVCDRNDNKWKAYNLEDIDDAMDKVKLKSDFDFRTEQEIFYKALKGKEIEFDGETQTAEPTMQM